MSGGGWSIRIPVLGQSLGIQGMAQWQQLGKMNPLTALKNLLGQWGGVDESVAAEHLSDVEWRDDDPFFMFNDKNVMKPQTPAATSTPVQTCEEEEKVVSSLKSPLEKKPCFRESFAKHLSKTAPTHFKPNYNDAELVGFTQPSLVNVIPWMKYEAQNMSEPSFRQELQCIMEIEHLRCIHHSDGHVVLMLETGSGNGGHCFPHVISRLGP